MVAVTLGPGKLVAPKTFLHTAPTRSRDLYTHTDKYKYTGSTYDQLPF
jgi:hypothetical protein